MYACLISVTIFVQEPSHVQVNIVEVSDHVFRRFLCDVLIQVFATLFSLLFAHPIRFDVHRSRV